MKKRALIFTFCLLLGLTLLSIPVFAKEDATNSSCEILSETVRYECRGGDTWEITTRRERCGDTIVTTITERLFASGICPYVLSNS